MAGDGGGGAGAGAVRREDHLRAKQALERDRDQERAAEDERVHAC